MGRIEDWEEKRTGKRRGEGRE
jgi:ATP-dependent RNA helicase RhlE